MEKKFEVGQVWRNREGECRTITHMYLDDKFPVATFEDDAESRTYTASGRYFSDGTESDADLVELVTNADGTPASAPIADPVNAAQAVETRVFDPTRAEFIDKLTHEIFTGSSHWSDADAAERIRAAVKVRDELVNGGAQ